MDEREIQNTVEAGLLAAGRPLTAEELRGLFDEFDRPSPEAVAAALDRLGAAYAERGIELTEVASGYRVQIRPGYASAVSRLWLERPPKYSRALLETLAIVAYRQPVTRGEIEDIRGVAVNPNIIKTLSERGWVRVVGHREVPGRPELLGTTREFLDHFNLKSLDQLPSLAQLKDLETLGVQLDLSGGATAEEALAEQTSAEQTSAEHASDEQAGAEHATAEAGEPVVAESPAPVAQDAG